MQTTSEQTLSVSAAAEKSDIDAVMSTVRSKNASPTLTASRRAGRDRLWPTRAPAALLVCREQPSHERTSL